MHMTEIEVICEVSCSIEDMGEYINKDDILMPTELVSEVKNNKKTTRKRKLYPGYIFVKVKLYDEDENFLEKPWYMIRAVNGVINFMGGDRRRLTAYSSRCRKARIPRSPR